MEMANLNMDYLLEVTLVEKPASSLHIGNGKTKTANVKSLLKSKKSKVKHLNDGNRQSNCGLLCEWCPYLCLKESDLHTHINLVHKLKKPSYVYEMLCPACPNIFHHKLSLQAHLNYDHGVSNNDDIAKIIQIALHTKKSKIFISCNKNPVKMSQNEKTSEEVNERIPATGDSNTTIYAENTVEKKTTEIKAEESIDIQSDSGEKPMDTDKIAEANGTILPQKLEPLTGTIKELQNDDKNPVGKFLVEKKVNKCPIDGCRTQMDDPKKMQYHILCHSDTIFRCPECKQGFTTYKPLLGHLWRIHNIDMELFKCDQCDYRTYSLGKLNNTHKLIHNSARNFSCDICLKTFKNLKQLNNHKYTHKANIHKGTKGTVFTHTCVECQKDFNNRSQLKIHINSIHKKLKPFVCSFCDFKAATKSALKIHTRLHTGEKPFTCDFCEYTCSDHNSLRRHKLRHTGQKPYKCMHCDYECIQTSTYKVHIKTKHPGLDKEIVFSCPACQFRSINRDVYNAHLYSQHPDLVKADKVISVDEDSDSTTPVAETLN